MVTRYQIVFIGHSNVFRPEIIDTFIKRVLDLGMDAGLLSILDENSFRAKFKRNAPTVAIYFGGNGPDHPNLNILEELFDRKAFIVPVVGEKNNFHNLVPAQLLPVNPFELTSETQVAALVNVLLECLGLLRLARRLFISYKRSESRSVAIQLFEKLEEAGFDVFLDTHSVRPGDAFQDELWHRLVDTDVVVLLNTPGFLESVWTTEEVAKASGMSVGILQLVWPKHPAERMSELSELLFLAEDDFNGGDFAGDHMSLINIVTNNVVEHVESMRARSLAARQDNIISEFISAANDLKKSANLQPEKFITMKDKSGKELILIPTVGVPHAFTYNQSEELIKEIRKSHTQDLFLLYDHRNIRDKWIDHLGWLDAYLPVQSLKIFGIEKWLEKI
jgi:TIR domain